MNAYPNNAANAAPSGVPRAIGAPPKAANPSCFGNIEDVTGMCANAASRVERTVGRLCGDYPIDPTAEVQASPNGLFDAADRQARDIRSSMERIFSAIDRLEKHLP